jgi:sugar-specific transcriptional regulator TrmB
MVKMKLLNGEINKILKNEFSLNNNEMLIFNHLIDNAEKMTAEGICKELDLPKGKIYDLLNSMEDKGLLSVDYKKPKVYYLENLKDCFERAFAMKEKLLMEAERKISAELKAYDKKKYDLKVITSDEELYIVRSNVVMGCKEYRMSSYNPFTLLREPPYSPKRRHREAILTSIIENHIHFKWLLSEEVLKELKMSNMPKLVKDVIKYETVDARVSRVIPNFDLGGDEVILKTTNAPGGPQIYIKSKEFATESAKLFDTIFDTATPIKNLIK